MKLYYGWVVVGAGALLSCVAMGTTFSLAVFLQPMSEATGWSRAGVSLAMTLVFITMGVGGFAWGALTDRCGLKLVVLSAGARPKFLFSMHRSVWLLRFVLMSKSPDRSIGTLDPGEDHPCLRAIPGCRVGSSLPAASLAES